MRLLLDLELDSFILCRFFTIGSFFFVCLILSLLLLFLSTGERLKFYNKKAPLKEDGEFNTYIRVKQPELSSFVQQ